MGVSISHKEELIDEVDRSGNVIATHPISRLKERMFFHNASLIIPAAEGNKIIIARRAKDKQPYPGTWVCGVGGHARSGESAEDAAKREMQEEIGRSYPIKKVTSFVYDKEYKAIFTLFTTTIPVSPDELSLDPREIQYCKAFTVGEVMRMIKRAPQEFAPTFITAMEEFSKHMA
jgi:isopentenyldiphosphate isomerase